MTDVKLVTDINGCDNVFKKPWNTLSYNVNALLFMKDI